MIVCVILFSCQKFFCQTENESISFSDIPDSKLKNVNYKSNIEPLQSSLLIQLPVGSIKPRGWLKTQLDSMIEGYTGHLYEISSFLSESSGWLGGEERGWEEAPYWLRGFYDLSVLTANKRIDSVASKWITSIINSQDVDGYYGSKYNKLIFSQIKKDSIIDVWPHMVMNDALISHYEATADERIIPMLINFFSYCNQLPRNIFLPQISWDYYENYRENFGDWKPRIQMKRAGDFIPQIYWLYNQTGEQWLLDFALKIYQSTQPEMNHWLDNHGVHFMQRFRYPAQMYPLTGDDFYLEKTNYFYEQFMMTWGHMPRGGFAADERIRNGKVDPRQGFESCAIVEGNKSFYILGNITGKTEYADQVEDLTFNWLPASTTADMKALRYLFGANMVNSIPDMDFQNGGSHPIFAASMHRCCQHNTAMGWPWFTKNLWKASPDNGLVAWMYAPNELHAKVGIDGEKIQINTITSYPFKDKVDFEIKLKKNTHFPLYFRVPGWASKLSLLINGNESEINDQNGEYIKVSRAWANGDIVSLVFKPEISLTKWPKTKAVTIDRGPLSYSVRIKENWVKSETDEFGWDKWWLLSDSEWNYGLVIDGLNLKRDIHVNKSVNIPIQPWSEENVPISLKVPVKRIPSWTATVKNTVDPLREGPIRSDEGKEFIEMIPMGAARLRITCLPVISDSGNARYWDSIPDPNVFMLER